MFAKLRKLVSTYQEVLVWMPPALFVVFLAFKLIPAIDPRSGIDGFGQIFAMLVNVIGGIMVCFSAWLTKRTYFSVIDDADLAQFRVWITSEAIDVDAKRCAVATMALDTLQWLGCFVFWAWVVF